MKRLHHILWFMSFGEGGIITVRIILPPWISGKGARLFFLVPAFGYIFVALASPVAWLFADLFLVPAYLYVMKRLRRKLDQSTPDQNNGEQQSPSNYHKSYKMAEKVL